MSQIALAHPALLPYRPRPTALQHSSNSHPSRWCAPQCRPFAHPARFTPTPARCAHQVLVDLKLSPEVLEIPVPKYFVQSQASRAHSRACGLPCYALPPLRRVEFHG